MSIASRLEMRHVGRADAESTSVRIAAAPVKRPRRASICCAPFLWSGVREAMCLPFASLRSATRTLGHPGCSGWSSFPKRSETAMSNITRLPTAARRKVRQPARREMIAARIAACIPSLPTPLDRRREAEALVVAQSRTSAEQLLLFSILRCLPAWQTQNVVRLVKAERQHADEESALLAFCLAAAAAERSVNGDGIR